MEVNYRMSTRPNPDLASVIDTDEAIFEPARHIEECLSNPGSGEDDTSEMPLALLGLARHVE